MKERTSSEEYISIVDGNAFLTNQLGYRVLELFKLGLTPEVVCECLEKEGYCVDVGEVIKVRDSLERLRGRRRRGTDIKTIFSVSLYGWERILKLLSFVFNFYVCLGLVLVIIYLLCNSSLTDLDTRNYFELLYNNPYLLFLYVVANILILFFHELGHVVAAYCCRIPVEKIGVGIYLSYIVFYTDVTNSWLGNRKERLLVDVGGLYFQLFFLAFFLLGQHYTDGVISVVFGLLFWDNLIIMLFNLNPLAMFDGYWILSDILDIKNLRHKSMHSLGELLLFVQNRAKLSHKPVLYVYSILSLSFLLYLYTSIIRELGLMVFSLVSIDFESGFVDKETLIPILKFFFLSFVFFLFTRTLWNYCKIIRNYVFEVQK